MGSLPTRAGFRRGTGFHLGYSPERINPGDDAHSVERMEKVVAGECSAVTDLLTAVYGKVTGGEGASVRRYPYR